MTQMPDAAGQPRVTSGRGGFVFGFLAGAVAMALVTVVVGWATGWWRVDAIDSSPAPVPAPTGTNAPLKPVIYLYPTAATDVTVTLSHPGRLAVSYPAYGDGWHVRAQPDGSLTDLATGRDLYALYYEGGRVVPAARTGEGFVVPGAQTAPFLEDALPRLGLSPREAEEFLIYWLPVLQANPYTYLRFESAAEQAQVQALTVTPAPDTVIRVMMDWQRLDAPVPVVPQALTAPPREGFVVVEWGGTPIPA